MRHLLHKKLARKHGKAEFPLEVMATVRASRLRPCYNKAHRGSSRNGKSGSFKYSKKPTCTRCCPSIEQVGSIENAGLLWSHAWKQDRRFSVRRKTPTDSMANPKKIATSTTGSVTARHTSPRNGFAPEPRTVFVFTLAM